MGTGAFFPCKESCHWGSGERCLQAAKEASMRRIKDYFIPLVVTAWAASLHFAVMVM